MSKTAVAQGQMYVKTGRETGFEFYEETFTLPDTVKTLPEARSVIRKGLLKERLEKTVKNFKGIRTCEITQFNDSAEVPEVDELAALLIEATKLGCVPENIDNYKRKDYKEKALKEAIERAKERKEKLAKKKGNVTDEGYVD